MGLDDLYRYLAAETVWKRPADTGRSTNCLINDAGIYVHKKTRGFHNYALPYGWDVRLGHKRREAAMKELDDEIDVGRVRRILREVGYELPARGRPLREAPRGLVRRPRRRGPGRAAGAPRGDAARRTWCRATSCRCPSCR